MSQIYNVALFAPLLAVRIMSGPALGAPQQKEESYETHPDSSKSQMFPKAKSKARLLGKAKSIQGPFAIITSTFRVNTIPTSLLVRLSFKMALIEHENGNSPW
jgi:hypothetical protein